MHELIDKIFRGVLTHRKGMLVGVIVLFIACALCIPSVKVNYQFSDYLPETTKSTISLRVMNEAFNSAAPNARMSVENLSLSEASMLAERAEKVDGINGVLWLGSVVDIKKPLEMYEQSTLNSWVKDGAYLYRITFASAKSTQASQELRAIAEDLGAENICMAGEAINTSSARTSSGTEIQLIMVLAVIVILGLLLLTSASWFEPVLFLAVIGISIVYNLGTNIIFGEISFITQMCAAILQLAVSMDYGIVMLHTYRTFKAQGLSSFEAAHQSMFKAAAVIASSAATTFFGFLSLCVMVFLIGTDMGLVLAKGIVFSFLSVLLILPVLILTFERMLEKTAHRDLLPSFDKFARGCMRVAVPFSIVIALIVVPCYLGQRHVPFVYGSSGFVSPGTQLYDETQYLEDKFGRAEQWVVLVPQGTVSSEKALTQDIKALPGVSSVTSFVTAVSENVPVQMVPENKLSSLVSGGYARLVVSTTVEGETPEVFNLIQEIRDTCDKYYPGENYLVGSAVTSYDMSTVVNEDTFRVFAASVIAVGLVLLLMFRSLVIPLLLLSTIEISIWINLAIPYFMGADVQYIGYLIISAIMLGATVDYTIILSRAYLDHRQVMGKREAMHRAISDSSVTILTSATILTVCGAIIGLVSSNGVISGLGTLVGRGGFIASLNTFLLLPMLFMIFDKLIEKTTLGARFYREEK